jgi:hypothetical protein
MRLAFFWLCLLAFAAQVQFGMADERVWRAGLLSNGPAQFRGIATSWRDEALRVLSHNGFTQGRNLELLEKYSEGKAKLLPRLAKELVVNVDAKALKIGSPRRFCCAPTR